MKRFLLTAALILAVVTSLTAGTLASYNQTLSIDGNVTAEKFNITAAGGTEFTEGISLSPGQSQWYKIAVTNSSDMAVDLKAKASLTGDLSSVLTATVYKSDKSTAWDSANTSLALGTSDSDKNYTFYVKVTWNTDSRDTTNARDNALSQKTAKLTVKVNGSYADTTSVHPEYTATPSVSLGDSTSGGF